MSNPHYSELIFPTSEQPSISHLLASLKRSTLSIHNRLTSIRADAEFVARVTEAFKSRPLVANERCGSWYVPPERKDGSAYFKSTDGHERAWKFSTRRLNLHLIDMIEKNDGIIIVDSTRRGKRMPDALSTTIPVWCNVLNLALLPSNPNSRRLFLPPSLPATTHAQISALIPQFLSSLHDLKLPLPTSLTNPSARYLRRLQTRRLLHRQPEGGRQRGGRRGYIQGAADDTENWAHGLTPPVFWHNASELLEAPEAELPDLIAKLVAQHRADEEARGGESDRRHRLLPQISVSPLPLSSQEPAAAAADEWHIALTSETTPRDTWVKSPRRMEVGVGRNKNASKNLRLALPDICDFAAKCFSAPGSSPAQIVIGCESGKDISVGTALAINCYLFTDDNQFRIPDQDVSFTKTLVKTRLGRIMTAFPAANPSRTTLQSVNSFLMDWRK
uniref:Initiator tRNA phosphoribosyl transferase n=1 Tax=Bionectria ochroleuca TaxID=29856 RepID=A0A8H7K8H2_BIOOC